MTPDVAVRGFVQRIRKRAMAAAAMEGLAAAWAAALACGLATYLWTGRMGATLVIVGIAGKIAGALTLAQRSRSWTTARLVADVERREPSFRNVLVTAFELLGHPAAARPYAREQVFRDAATIAARVSLRDLYPYERPVGLLAVAGIAWIAVGGFFFATGRAFDAGDTPAMPNQAARATGAPAVDLSHVVATITPPAYTGRATSQAPDPIRLDVLAGSTVRLDGESRAPAVRLSLNGGVAQRIITRGGRFTTTLPAVTDGVVALEPDVRDGDAAARARRLIAISVAPDREPAVRIAAPARDLVVPDASRRIRVDIRADDDLGLADLRLRYTKVSGSGEQFTFADGDVPLRVTRHGADRWEGTADWNLGALALEPGDMLVYRAAARDRRPDGGTAVSDAYVVEIARTGGASATGFSVPEERNRFAVSQQMVIVKTERLHERRGRLPAADVRAEAQDLAREQRMVRAEFVFMLGGEVEDEAVEAEQSHELAEGRQENRGQRDLLAATRAMSRAEQLLAGADTARALGAERTALAALQRAFDRRRYILRALPDRRAIDPSRRLTGEIASARSWTRVGVAIEVDEIAARLQPLQARVAALLDAPPDPAAGAALAARVLQIDPADRDVQTAGRAMLDAGRGPDAAAWRAALQQVSRLLQARLQPRLAPAASSDRGAGATRLAGAFADALARRPR